MSIFFEFKCPHCNVKNTLSEESLNSIYSKRLGKCRDCAKEFAYEICVSPIIKLYKLEEIK